MTIIKEITRIQIGTFALPTHLRSPRRSA